MVLPTECIPPIIGRRSIREAEESLLALRIALWPGGKRSGYSSQIETHLRPNGDLDNMWTPVEAAEYKEERHRAYLLCYVYLSGMHIYGPGIPLSDNSHYMWLDKKIMQRLRWHGYVTFSEEMGGIFTVTWLGFAFMTGLALPPVEHPAYTL